METMEKEDYSLNNPKNNLEANENEVDEIVIYYYFGCCQIIIFIICTILFLWFPFVIYLTLIQVRCHI